MKLRHVAIRCDDLEWGAKHYAETFELEEVGRAGDIHKSGAVYLSDGVMNVALIKVGAADRGGADHVHPRPDLPQRAPLPQSVPGGEGDRDA
jgi:hypothetical protein